MSTEKILPTLKNKPLTPNEINGFIGDSAEETADHVADALSTMQWLMTLQKENPLEADLHLDPPEVTGLYFIFEAMKTALQFHSKQGGAQ